MANEAALRRVQELAKNGEIEMARDLLKTMLDDPRAVKWLNQLNDRYPPDDDDDPPDEQLWESDSRDKRLIQAQQLLRAGRYKEARWLLVEIRHIPQAQEWLIELDTIEARSKAAHREAAEQAKVAQTPSGLQALGDVVRSATFRVGVGSGIVAAALAIIVMWMTLPWINGAGDFELNSEFGNQLKCTAFELNIGRYKCQQMLYVEPEIFLRGNSGFVAVRIVDRGLLVLPFLAVVGAATGWLYAGGRLDTFTSLSIITFCGVMFAVVPFLWESLSASQAEDQWARFAGVAAGKVVAAYLETTYQTVPFKAFGVVTALFVSGAAALAMAEANGMLGVARPRGAYSDRADDELGAAIFDRGRKKRN